MLGLKKQIYSAIDSSWSTSKRLRAHLFHNWPFQRAHRTASTIFAMRLAYILAVLVVVLSASCAADFSDETTTSADYLVDKEDINRTLYRIVEPSDPIALLLDFDGTLGEIQPNPKMTTIDADAKRFLDTLATRRNVFVAIISGRRVHDVRQRVGVDGFTYSGNHGMEIAFANGTEYHYPIGADVYRNCTALKAILVNEFERGDWGGWIEDKNISLVYHYGDVAADLQRLAVAAASAAVTKYGFRPVQSHSAIEIKPPVVWSKGHAASLILAEAFGVDWPSQNVRVMFVGDDTSDEDVMQRLLGRGTSFRVTKDPELSTYANFKLQSVETVTYLLDWLVNDTE